MKKRFVFLLFAAFPFFLQANSSADGPYKKPVPAAKPRPTAKPTPPLPVMFPFVLPPFDASKTATDVSWLNPAPAGAAGFIGVRGEHFVDGQGRPFRFWGVNLNFSGAFPNKEEAPQIAARLAKFGFNAARFHHFDGNAAPNGIWKPARFGTTRVKIPREIDPEQLDRFDFFVAQLIERGIYINLNLHVGRKVQDGEGFRQAALLPDKDKGINYYNERLIAAHQEFARLILTHVNPYTGRAYGDEPGVCAVEVTNENSLLGMWLDDALLKAPEEYLRPLHRRWNAWLRDKYSEESLRAAWTELDDPIHPEEMVAPPWPFEVVNPNSPDSKIAIAVRSLGRFRLATAGGAAGGTEVGALTGPRVNGALRSALTARLQTTGSVSWAFQLNRDGLNLQDDQPYTLTFWARANAPRRISANLWQDRSPHRFAGFSSYANLGNTWRKYSFVFRPSSPEPGSLRLSFNLGNQTGVVQLAEIEIRGGGRLAAPEDWTLSNGVPLIDFRTTQVWLARRDFAEFLGTLEKEHVTLFRNFLRDELGVRCPIWHSQAQFGGWGGVWREMESDAIDVHAYWKHPDFGAAGWNGNGWKIDNVSMTKGNGNGQDPLTAFALFRVAGKPFVMSEWNNGQPNDFGAETLLMAAAYAAWQDWAGVYLFDYHSSGSYNRNHFEGFFSIDTHPVKMATAPAAALLYRRPAGRDRLLSTEEPSDAAQGDLAVAVDEVTLTLPRDMMWHEVANASGPPAATPIVKTWRAAGAAHAVALQGKAYVRFDDVLFPTVTKATVDTTTNFVSDTRQLRWDKKQAIFSVNAPQSKTAIGFLGGRSISLGELKIAMPASRSNFASFALSSLDGAEIARSERLLLTAAGGAENIGMGWNASRTTIGTEWGRGPTHVEGIIASVQILSDALALDVWSLDETGARRAQVPATLDNGTLKFALSPQWKTLWYEIVARE